MNCKNCGAPISAGTNNCPNCGSGVVNNQVQNMNNEQVQPVINRPPIAGLTSNNQSNSRSNVPKGPGFNILAGVEENKVDKAPAPNNDNSGIGMVMLLLFFVAIAVGGYTLYNKLQDKPYEPDVLETAGNNDSEENPDIEEPALEEKINYVDNIKFKEEVKLFDGSIMLVYENDNMESLSVDLNIEFYDKEGLLLGNASDSSIVAANGEFYFLIASNSVREGYDNYKTDLSATLNEGLTRLDLLISDFVIRNDGNKFSIQYPNKTNTQIDILKMCVTYYNVNDIVQISCDTKKNIDVTGTASFEFEYGTKKAKGMTFTNYKISTDAYTTSVTVEE